MKVLVIGINSFISQHLRLTVGTRNWIFKTHEEIKLDAPSLINFDVVINLAVAPSIFTNDFKDDDDFDVWLAQHLQHNSNAHFVMISTRQVYGDFECLTETSVPLPSSAYGQNKLRTEYRVSELIDSARLTILRCSNVFGFEPGRRTFFGIMLTSLISDSVIRFNISPKTKKDFITVQDCAQIISQVALKRLPGLYNLGSGLDVECGALGLAVIKGYTMGQLISNSKAVEGQFSMDVSKLSALINYPKMTERALELEAENIGSQLKVLALKAVGFKLS